MIIRKNDEILSEFMNYLATQYKSDNERIPSLSKLSKTLGISVTTLREQLEVARMLGVVDVKPKAGIHRQQYKFHPAVVQSLAYSVKLDRSYFDSYSDLRNHLESAYWVKGTSLLSGADHHYLRELVQQALDKLRGDPIEIPHWEHRELHMTIYRKLDNIYVTGILEAYWDLYEAVGLSLFADYEYLQNVWGYHGRMVGAISNGDIEKGYLLMMEHMGLLQRRSRIGYKQDFE